MRLALVATGLVLLASAATAAGSTLPGYYGCSALFLKERPHTKTVIRPRSIVVACGDGGFSFVRMQWTSWTGTTAHATATASVNDCTPNCAAGHFHSYPATVVLSRVRTCKNGVRAFTQIGWSYTHTRPKGVARSGSERYSC